MTIKCEAEALRLGLILGLVEPTEVVAWADRLILQDRAAEFPTLLDLSVSTTQPLGELVSLLGAVPGEADRPRVGALLARQLYKGLVAEHFDVVAAAQCMFRLVLKGYSPDAEFTDMAYVADHEVDHALEGAWDALSELTTEVQTFLERYARDAPSS